MSTNNRRAIAGELRRKANDSLDGESLQRALARMMVRAIALVMFARIAVKPSRAG